jgi:hypothetical protein
MVNLTTSSDSAFNELVNRLFKETSTRLVKWNIDKTWFEDEVTVDVEEWDTAYADDANPLTKNKLSTSRKNAARKKLEPVMRKLIEFLRGNVKVSDDDKRMLGIYLAPHDTHAIPATTKSPSIRVDLEHIRRITGFLFVEGEETKGKPDDVASVQMAHTIIEDDDREPVTINRLMHENLDLYSNSFMLEFDDEDRGKRSTWLPATSCVPPLPATVPGPKYALQSFPKPFTKLAWAGTHIRPCYFLNNESY